MEFQSSSTLYFSSSLFYHISVDIAFLHHVKFSNNALALIFTTDWFRLVKLTKIEIIASSRNIGYASQLPILTDPIFSSLDYNIFGYNLLTNYLVQEQSLQLL